MNVTIIGGHGKIALLLAPLLVQAGHDVVSVIRNPDHVDDVEATGATAMVESIEDADTPAIVELLHARDAVVWSAGAGGGNPARTIAVDRDAAIRTIDAAVEAGVRRFVMVSFSGSDRDFLVDDDPFNTYMRAKIDADEHLRASELEWTILAPGALTLERGTGTVNPDATFRNGDRTSRELVAQVAASVVDDPRAVRATLVFGDGDMPIETWLDHVAAHN